MNDWIDKEFAEIDKAKAAEVDAQETERGLQKLREIVAQNVRPTMGQLANRFRSECEKINAHWNDRNAGRQLFCNADPGSGNISIQQLTLPSFYASISYDDSFGEYVILATQKMRYEQDGPFTERQVKPLPVNISVDRQAGTVEVGVDDEEATRFIQETLKPAVV